MVVILMSADGGAAPAIGRALAEALGWRRAEARDPRALHATIDAVLGRREHLVVTTPVFNTADQAIVRGDLRHVRFVDLSGDPGDTGATVHAIRNDFGL